MENMKKEPTFKFAIKRSALKNRTSKNEQDS